MEVQCEGVEDSSGHQSGELNFAIIGEGGMKEVGCGKGGGSHAVGDLDRFHCRFSASKLW